MVNKTCAVTGHRKIYENISEDSVKKVFETLIQCGIDRFLVGMAVGFDTLCFHVLEKIKKNNPDVKIVACIPCVDQAINFSDKDKMEYERMLSVADEKIYVSQQYTVGCMMRRNIYMVENSCVLVAYLRENKGGTKNTVEYAMLRDKRIFYV